jgi:uncharacterized protein (DUF433 family)
MWERNSFHGNHRPAPPVGSVSLRWSLPANHTVEPGTRDGNACLRGYRLTVEPVPAWLAEGATFADLREQPFLEPKDVTAELRYGREPGPRLQKSH